MSDSGKREVGSKRSSGELTRISRTTCIDTRTSVEVQLQSESRHSRSRPTTKENAGEQGNRHPFTWHPMLGFDN